MEYVAEEETTLRDRLTRQDFVAKDGYVTVPEEPGLGVELNEDGMRQFRVF
jgi:L-alanine-DL-glutamate epimerase-like enolase superfamily enzyme